MKNKYILKEQEFNMQVLPTQAPPGNAVAIDQYGRLVVDGKLFMPIGAYTTVEPNDLDLLADTGFNTVLCYYNLGMRHKPYSKTKTENINRILNLINEKSLKIIFSLKDLLPHLKPSEFDGIKGNMNVAKNVVRSFKDHPALLAWYIGDEESLSAAPKVISLREAVSFIDPWHPTWCATYSFNGSDFPAYATLTDITGFEFYPVKTGQKTDLSRLGRDMNAVMSSGMPCWGIPQIFNWGVHQTKTPEEYAKTRHPTFEEMLGNALLFAIKGARGFIFYSYDDIFYRADKRVPGSGEKVWVDVRKMIGILKSLEPFIMSIEKGPTVTIHDDVNNQVFARAFVAGTDIRIMVVGSGKPCKVKLEISGYPDLQSELGQVKNLGNGMYEIKFDDVGVEILGNK